MTTTFDPCGTRRVDGKEILERLAKHLSTNPYTLRCALINVIDKLAQGD